MEPLVSILIPAYNAEEWIAETMQSAIAQTWPRKEILVVDDGSRDRTAEVARRFESQGVRVVSTENHGPSAARNHAYKLSEGDYIQYLDADDLLAPDKVERQLEALAGSDGARVALVSKLAHFYYRTKRMHPYPSPPSGDLSPAEFLLGEMAGNWTVMQASTFLISRELAEAAGPWNTRLCGPEDGEYLGRVLLAATRVRFVRGALVYYRAASSNRVSYIGTSDEKKNSKALAMRLRVQYLRSLEESERVHKASLIYLQNWFDVFYPERPDLVSELQTLAAELGGHLDPPHLRWKYAWVKPIFGWKAAKWAQRTIPNLKAAGFKFYDRLLYKLLDSGRGRTHDFSHKETIERFEAKGCGATMSGPLVLILIPAYNAEEWIAEAIPSSIAQTWPRKEIIVVDDGSKDRTAELEL